MTFEKESNVEEIMEDSSKNTNSSSIVHSENENSEEKMDCLEQKDFLPRTTNVSMGSQEQTYADSNETNLTADEKDISDNEGVGYDSYFLYLVIM